MKKPSTIAEATAEMMLVAAGKAPVARITIKGHAYVPEAKLEEMKKRLQEAIRVSNAQIKTINGERQRNKALAEINSDLRRQIETLRKSIGE